MVRWHEQARQRRALKSMWNQVFGALPPADLGGAAPGKRVGSRAFGRGGLDRVAGGRGRTARTQRRVPARHRGVLVARTALGRALFPPGFIGASLHSAEPTVLRQLAQDDPDLIAAVADVDRSQVRDMLALSPEQRLAHALRMARALEGYRRVRG